MKIIFGLLSSALFLSSAFANELSSFNGFYLGARAGEDIILGKGQITKTASARTALPAGIFVFLDSINLSANNNMNKNAFFGEVHLGYSKPWEPFYIGGEIQVNTQNYKITGSQLVTLSAGVTPVEGGPTVTFANSTSSLNSAVSIGAGQWAVSLCPGLFITPDLLFYGRLGAGFPKIKSQMQDVTNNRAFGSTTAAFDLVSSTSKRHNSLQLGAGFAYAINAGWEFTVDYIFYKYGSLTNNINTNSAIVVNDGLQTRTVNFSANSVTKLQSQIISLGVGYYLF